MPRWVVGIIQFIEDLVKRSLFSGQSVSGRALQNDKDELNRSESDLGEEEKPKKKKPPKIGPKRGATGTGNISKVRKAPILWPELVCRESSGSRWWEIILRSRQEHRIAEVQHNGEILLPDDDGEYHLPNFSGMLLVSDSSGDKKEFPLFDSQKPLIFKTPNDWKGDGRRMNGITQGDFVVVAPHQWKRTGHVSNEPAPCSDSDFLAHFFSTRIDHGEKTSDGFKEYSLPLKKERFTLRGKRIVDDSEDGELFVENLPDLNLVSNVVWVRVGEERKGGWVGEDFKPADTSLGTVLNGRQGRFFIRVYDGEGNMMDSGQFRYCAGLREVQVNGAPYSHDMILNPPSGGHPETTVRFVEIGEADCHFKVETGGVHATVKEGGVVTVAPHPEGDRLVCTLTSESGCVEVVIKLPRIWWRLKHDDNCMETWHDAPFVMTREEFQKHADAGAVIQLRMPMRIKSVYVGFDDGMDREIPIKSELFFEDFLYDEQIYEPLHEDSTLQIRHNDLVIPLIRVTADPPLQQVCPLSEPTSPRNRVLAQVKCRRCGWRIGAGFSYGELQEADLTCDGAAHLRVPVDRRRGTVHKINVKALEEVKDNA